MLSQDTVLFDKGCRPSTCDMICPHYGSHVRYYNQQNIEGKNQPSLCFRVTTTSNNTIYTGDHSKKVQDTRPLSSTIPNQPNTSRSTTDRLNEVNRKVLSGGGVSPRDCGGAWLGGHAHWLQAPRSELQTVVFVRWYFPAHPPWVCLVRVDVFWCPPLGLS